MTKVRLQYIDALKGFLIVTVVIGHIIQKCFFNPIDNQVFRIIYSFHMPMFMFLSGFVSYKPDKIINSKDEITQKFTRLMLPFLVWTFVVNPLVEWNLDIVILKNKILYPDTGLWFLWVLFFIYVFYLLLIGLSNKAHIKQPLILLCGAISLFIIYLVTNFRYFGFQFISWYFMSFTLGFFFNKYQPIFNKYQKYLFIVSIIVFPILAWNWQMKQMPIVFGFSINNSLWLYTYKFITIIFAIPFFMNLFKILEGKLTFLINLGKNTLGIYIIHFLLLSWIVEPIFRFASQFIELNILTSYSFVFVMVILVVLICNLLIYFIRKVKILKLLLLGEKD